ncbi:MAG: AAA family ATPase, partial [Candidatus Buchananbacteria bacterium]
MNPKEAKNDIYQIVPCPICQGTGKIAEKKCFDCQGFKAVLFNGVNFLVWRREISASRISRDKIKKLISNLILLSLFIFGGAGIISLGWEIYYFSQAHLPISQIYQQKSWPLFIFWLSILSDLFIFYHFQRDLEKNKVISWQNEFNPKKRRLIAAESLNHLPKNTQDIGDYYSLLARQVLDKAWQQAGRFENDQVEPIHLFIALLSFNKIQTIFSRLGVPFPSIKKRIENALAKLPHQDSQAPRISDKIIDIIYTSYLNALANHQDKVDIIEIFETLAQQPNEVKELLYDLDITPDKINNVVAWMRINKQLLKNWQKFKHKAGLRPKNRLNRSMTAIATPVLDKFSQDLTALAQNGYLMPCIGREKEIQEIFNVLSGGPRRSALLLGFPGVGKNTIIEGIAQKMVEEDVPDFLQDMRLVSLSVAKLVSGTDPASAQGRLMAILNEIRRSGNILLFVGDIQNMIGITAGRQGSIDLADVLAQVLATNSVLALATALPGDYKHYIEGQSSLDNVFEKVNIEETSGDEAIRILEAKAGSIEYHESIFFSYGAIAETIKLSSRYLHDRFLPEKAIQILQEAAAMVKNSKGKNSMVLANDIAALISSKTNIPLTEITIQESEKLLNLEDKIHERLINQEEAVKMVATSLRRARAEMRDLARPISNFLFLGPTGVGKTELA